MSDRAPARLAHLDGSHERVTGDPSVALEGLLAEVEGADEEHTDVSVIDESEWSLSVYRGGHLIWGDLEGDDELEMLDVPRDEVLAIMLAVAEGRLDDVHARAWTPRP